MPTRPEPPPAPAADRCPHRHYRTDRYARRQAWSADSNPQTRPTPVPCECGSGAWRLDAVNDTRTTTTEGA